MQAPRREHPARERGPPKRPATMLVDLGEIGEVPLMKKLRAKLVPDGGTSKLKLFHTDALPEQPLPPALGAAASALGGEFAAPGRPAAHTLAHGDLANFMGNVFVDHTSGIPYRTGDIPWYVVKEITDEGAKKQKAGELKPGATLRRHNTKYWAFGLTRAFGTDAKKNATAQTPMVRGRPARARTRPAHVPR
jgi:hypothetical protein